MAQHFKNGDGQRRLFKHRSQGPKAATPNAWRIRGRTKVVKDEPVAKPLRTAIRELVRADRQETGQ